MGILFQTNQRPEKVFNHALIYLLHLNGLKCSYFLKFRQTNVKYLTVC